VHGPNNNDVINLGSGSDTVYLGNGETVNGGSGTDRLYETSATIGTTIKGGSGTNDLFVLGGGTMAMGANMTGINLIALETAGSSYNFTTNTTQGLIIAAGADADTINVGSSSQTVNGTIGNLLVRVTAADAGVAISSSTGSNELDITTGGTVALNSALNNITAQLDGASTLTLDPMKFIHAVGTGGNDVIIAGAAGQVLTGGGGHDTLQDGSPYGVAFRDTVAGFLGDTLASFSKADVIDITNLGSGMAAPIYDGTYGASCSGVCWRRRTARGLSISICRA
jgi:Ca2+-binding RTX toxin-like protein